MSCDWHVHCRTCGDTHRFNDANHQDDLMRVLVRHRHAIAALVPLMSDQQTWVDIELRTDWGNIDPEWFLKHANHDLVPIDEYGQCSDECGEYFACECCQTRKSCKLLAGHAGPHSMVRP